MNLRRNTLGPAIKRKVKAVLRLFKSPDRRDAPKARFYKSKDIDIESMLKGIDSTKLNKDASLKKINMRLKDGVPKKK